MLKLAPARMARAAPAKRASCRLSPLPFMAAPILLTRSPLDTWDCDEFGYISLQVDRLRAHQAGRAPPILGPGAGHPGLRAGRGGPHRPAPAERRGIRQPPAGGGRH